MCKHGDVFSLRVLIGRGLDLLLSLSSLFFLRLLQFSGFYLIQFAPLAQLVEQLTLNQRVEGSSPSGVTLIERDYSTTPYALDVIFFFYAWFGRKNFATRPKNP